VAEVSYGGEAAQRARRTATSPAYDVVPGGARFVSRGVKGYDFDDTTVLSSCSELSQKIYTQKPNCE
jgi:hypothetical protein